MIDNVHTAVSIYDALIHLFSHLSQYSTYKRNYRAVSVDYFVIYKSFSYIFSNQSMTNKMKSTCISNKNSFRKYSYLLSLLDMPVPSLYWSYFHLNWLLICSECWWYWYWYSKIRLPHVFYWDTVCLNYACRMHAR